MLVVVVVIFIEVVLKTIFVNIHHITSIIHVFRKVTPYRLYKLKTNQLICNNYDTYIGLMTMTTTVA